MATAFLRLASDAVSVRVDHGIALYSNRGALLLDGDGAAELTDKLFPLLDGTRSASDVCAALPQVDLLDLLGILRQLKAQHIILSSEAELSADGTGGEDEVARRLIASFVHPDEGIIRRITIEDCATTGVTLPVVANAIPADRLGAHVGWGKGLTTSAAVIGAIAESVERYSASVPNPVHIVEAHLEDLPGDILDPRSFPLYSEAQYRDREFPFMTFDPAIPHPWVRGEWLHNRNPVWVPAVLTYLSMDLRRGQLFVQGSSNGLAAGTSFEDASVRAVLELLERDAFMCAWRLKKPGKRIALDDTLEPELHSILEGVRALGACTELLLLPSVCDCPTVLALAFGNGTTYPGVTLGLGAHPDPRVALRQAILELGQTGPYLRRMMITNRYPVPSTCGDVRQMLDHATYYFPKERASAFDFLLADRSEVRMSDLAGWAETSLIAIADRITKAGIRVALVDVTASDLMASPLRVVRALSPDLQPIHFGYGMDRLPVGRLGTVTIRPNDLTPIW